MKEKSRAEKRHARLVGALRLVAALAWLAFTALVFEVPIQEHLAPPEEVAEELPPVSEPGFMVEILSLPSGGRLMIDGVDRGVVPIWTNVACREGQEVTFEVRKEGYSTWQRVLTCREGESRKLTAQLRR